MIPVYTIQLFTVHVCTKFQSSRPHSYWEKCDENFHLEGYGMWDSQSDRMMDGQCKSSMAPTFSKWDYKKIPWKL